MAVGSNPKVPNMEIANINKYIDIIYPRNLVVKILVIHPYILTKRIDADKYITEIRNSLFIDSIKKRISPAKKAPTIIKPCKITCIEIFIVVFLEKKYKILNTNKQTIDENFINVF